MRSSCSGRPETVSHVSNGLDEEMVGIFHLASQSADVNVHGACAAEVVVFPDTVEEGLTGIDTSRIGGEQA